jgi:uncharacterized membrane protein (DUF2068 family)
MIGLIFLLLVSAGAWSFDAWLGALRAIARAVLAPFMIHELFPSLSETASGSHPCCVVFSNLRPDLVLSRRKRGFKSRRGRQTNSLGEKRLLSV